METVQGGLAVFGAPVGGQWSIFTVETAYKALNMSVFTGSLSLWDISVYYLIVGVCYWKHVWYPEE